MRLSFAKWFACGCDESQRVGVLMRPQSWCRQWCWCLTTSSQLEAAVQDSSNHSRIVHTFLRRFLNEPMGQNNTTAWESPGKVWGRSIFTVHALTGYKTKNELVFLLFHCCCQRSCALDIFWAVVVTSTFVCVHWMNSVRSTYKTAQIKRSGEFRGRRSGLWTSGVMWQHQ